MYAGELFADDGPAGIGLREAIIVELGQLAGLSKPMTIAGLKQLQGWGFIEAHSGRPTLYRIAEYETAKYWTKLPKAHLYGHRVRRSRYCT